MLLLRCNNYALIALLNKYILSLALNWSTLGLFLNMVWKIIPLFWSCYQKTSISESFPFGLRDHESLICVVGPKFLSIIWLLY